MNELSTSHNAVKEKHAELQSALTNSEELLQTLLTGLSSSSSTMTGGGYMGQLAEARTRVAQAATEHEQCLMKLSMNEKELKTLQARWKEVEREAGDGKKQVESMRAEIEKFRRKIAETGWTVEREQQVEGALREARAAVRQLTEVTISLFLILACQADTLNSNETRSSSACQTWTSITLLHQLTSIVRK